MKGKISISTIIFIIILLLIIYAVAKLFIWKEPLGINAIDKFFTKKSVNAIIGRWQKFNDPTYNISFNEAGQWRSTIASGTYTFINSKCLQLINASSTGLTTISYLYLNSITSNEFYAATCGSSCNNCDNNPERYIRMKYEEKKILKDFAPESAL